MSEQEDTGLTIEGLAQRLEALEQAQAGEEPGARFYGPASMGEQGSDGLTLLEEAH
jgi:hypothetical protein